MHVPKFVSIGSPASGSRGNSIDSMSSMFGPSTVRMNCIYRRRATRREVRRATLRPPNIDAPFCSSREPSRGSGGRLLRLHLVMLCSLVGRHQADLDEIERADEAVADPEAAGAEDRVAERNGPLVLEEDDGR